MEKRRENNYKQMVNERISRDSKFKDIQKFIQKNGIKLNPPIHKKEWKEMTEQDRQYLVQDLLDYVQI